MALRTHLLATVAVLAALVGFANAAEAGWVTIKNDSNKAIVVQQTETVNGQAKPGKPVRLLPGECIREQHGNTCMRTVEVFDGQQPCKSLNTTTLTGKPEGQTLTVSGDGRTATVAAEAARK